MKRNPIILENRAMTSVEFERMKQGFDEHTLDRGVKIQSADRFGCVATEYGKFVGCSSGLAYKSGTTYNGWFYLTDLFVEQKFRSQKIGQQLLIRLEKAIKAKGITKIWVWTAGYAAPAFYQKLGYQIFEEMEKWYSDGSSRLGLKKYL
ncbi:MAG: GNAT family N-acetyltransferase [Bacteroidota bacterium]